MNQLQTFAKGISRNEFIALIAALTSLNAVAIDIVLPALPHIGEHFNLINANQRQLVLPIYLLGFGIAQLIYGPLSDRFGRRVPLFFGLLLYCAATCLAIVVPTFTMLLVLRFIQGVGAAATRVLAFSTIRDCYSGPDMAAIMSLVFMTFMIVPVIAPFLGQTILSFSNWQGIFVLMSACSLAFGLWAYFRLPETLVIEKRRPLNASAVIEGLLLVVSNRTAMAYALANTFIFGGLFAYLSSCQQIFVDFFALGKWFPLAFGSIATVIALSSFANTRLVVILGLRRLSNYAIVISTITAALLLFLALSFTIPFWVFFVCMAIIMFMFGCSGSNINALSMEPLGEVAGTASAVFGFIQTAGGAFFGVIVGQSFDGTLIPLALSYVAFGILALGCNALAHSFRAYPGT